MKARTEEFEVVYEFHNDVPGPLQLLRDESGDWYLGDNEQPSQKVSIPDALEWYSRQRAVTTDSTGDISPLCSEAAKLLQPQTSRSLQKSGGHLDDSLAARIAYWEERKGTDGPLLELEVVIKSCCPLGAHPNVLLRDEADNFYLEHACQWWEGPDGGKVIGIAADSRLSSAPITAIRKGQLKPVSAGEALEWFAKASEWMESFEGSEGELLRIAAKKLKELERSTAS